jgi:hypothetical protein
MPAPKNPNVTSAAAARRRIGDLTASNRLTKAGYLVLSPEDLGQLPESLRAELQDRLARADRYAPHGLSALAPLGGHDRVTTVPLCEHGDDAAACQLAHRSIPTTLDSPAAQ